MSLLLTLLLLAQTDKPAPAPSAERQTALATALIKQLAAGEVEKATEPLDGAMKKALPATSPKPVWDGPLTLYGKFEKPGAAGVEAAPPYQIIFVTMHFARGRLDAKVVFNAEDKIA